MTDVAAQMADTRLRNGRWERLRAGQWEPWPVLQLDRAGREEAERVAIHRRPKRPEDGP